MIKINNIYWKRTLLYIEYEANKQVDLLLINYYDKSKIIARYEKFDTKKITQNKYVASFNILAPIDNKVFSSENWYLTSCETNEKININRDIMDNIDNLSKVFRYGKNNYAYTITVHLTEDCSLMLYCDFMKKNVHPERNAFVGDKKLHLLVKEVLNFIYKILSKLYKKSDKNILFLEQNGTHLTSNLQVIKRRLMTRGLNQTYNIKTNCRNKNLNRRNMFYLIKILCNIAWADYIFIEGNVSIFDFISLSRNTTLIQVPKYGFEFNLDGYTFFGTNDKINPFNSCYKKCTYGIVGNENLKDVYSQAWGINKDSIMATGLPRLENFLDKEKINEAKNKFYQKFPEFKSKKIITFIPSYRGSKNDAFYDYTKLDLDSLYEMCRKNNYIFICRKHNYIKDDLKILEKYSDLIYNLPSYHLNSLLYVTDILITDYSPIFYDFMLLKRPILFYMYDKKEYIVNNDYIDVLPGMVCTDFNDLLNLIDAKNYKENNTLMDNCMSNKKSASDQIIDSIILKK